MIHRKHVLASMRPPIHGQNTWTSLVQGLHRCTTNHRRRCSAIRVVIGMNGIDHHHRSLLNARRALTNGSNAFDGSWAKAGWTRMINRRRPRTIIIRRVPRHHRPPTSSTTMHQNRGHDHALALVLVVLRCLGETSYPVNTFPLHLSLFRTPSLPREPWRSTNQNDYPWRDAHLPAYREATLARSQTPPNQSRGWKEPVDSTYYPSGDDTTSRSYHYVSTPYYGKKQSSSYDHSFYSDIPSDSTSSCSMKPVDSTRYHKLYSSNDNALHIVPKDGSTLDPPYLKILNAPVTYLH